MDSLQVTEDASAAVATAPRITKKFIEDQIEREFYVLGDALVSGGEKGLHVPDGVIVVDPAPDEWQPLYAHHTICVLTTKAGFTVIGHSAPASPANFNTQLGRQLAYENAFRQLWPLFAFAALEAVERFGPNGWYPNQ